MLISERARDRTIRNKQKAENHAMARLIKILKSLDDYSCGIESDVPRSICPLDGCLMFPSDPSCPACQLRLLS